jgi:hypothetical protein
VDEAVVKAVKHLKTVNVTRNILGEYSQGQRAFVRHDARHVDVKLRGKRCQRLGKIESVADDLRRGMRISRPIVERVLQDLFPVAVQKF